MFAASHRPGSIFSGICYLIKNDILDKMIKMANDCDIHETSAPEDMTIGCLATICSMPNSIYIMPEWNPNKNFSLLLHLETGLRSKAIPKLAEINLWSSSLIKS